jgi:hypothetical protein
VDVNPRRTRQKRQQDEDRARESMPVHAAEDGKADTRTYLSNSGRFVAESAFASITISHG